MRLLKKIPTLENILHPQVKNIFICTEEFFYVSEGGEALLNTGEPAKFLLPRNLRSIKEDLSSGVFCKSKEKNCVFVLALN